LNRGKGGVGTGWKIYGGGDGTLKIYHSPDEKNREVEPGQTDPREPLNGKRGSPTSPRPKKNKQTEKNKIVQKPKKNHPSRPKEGGAVTREEVENVNDGVNQERGGPSNQKIGKRSETKKRELPGEVKKLVGERNGWGKGIAGPKTAENKPGKNQQKPRKQRKEKRRCLN